ncbi:MAG: hypothetical protein RMN25_05630 [Anaerolineae bacterium]|nr:hypothetical protein [Thermoflexales bacterium]MDW8407246.1 hypothetical protein [Anaerolineae bacterium]
MSDSGDSHLDDVRLDQSNRITRRIAHGAYRILHGHRIVGDEAWGIFGLLNGGYRLLTEIEQDWPAPHQQRICLDVDAHWQPKTSWLQLEIEGVRHNAKYTIAGGNVRIDIQHATVQRDEQSVRPSSSPHSQRRPGMQPAPSQAGYGLSQSNRLLLEQMIAWEEDELTSGLEAFRNRARAVGQPVNSRSHLPFGNSTHLDFASTLSNFIVLQRVNLQPGMAAHFDSIVPQLPELTPLRVEQSYTCQGEEPVRGDPAKPITRRYQITESSPDHSSGAAASPTVFWADEHGIVLAQELTIGGEPHGCEMIRYTWLG